MKRNVLFHMAIFAFATLALTDANAASAVVTDDNGNIAAACGGPVEKAKQRALADAHRRYGPRHFRIFASTPLTGYCAIAVARHPNGVGSLIGVALGKRSATEADTLAIEQCVRAGGTEAKIRRGFRG
jgi:hypothetical protein